MRITTWNVNGLRAALRKGFADHIERIAPDVLLLQEIRVLPDQLPAEWVNPDGWHVHWHPAERKGYAGTAIWSREPFEFLGTGIKGDSKDLEGRVVRACVSGVQVGSIYLPSGSSSEDRQAVKEVWMKKFLPWAKPFTKDDTPIVLGGDFNIAHTEQDIFYAKSNEKTSGFLPHEREWFSRLLKSGWHDTLREHTGDMQGPYSWWSNRGRARELDRGWRIDYLLANQPAAARMKAVTIHREGGLEVSDHAPVSLDLSD